MKAMRLNYFALCAAPLWVALSLSASPAVGEEGHAYQQHNLVSDGTIPADHVDSDLVNPWGVAFNPNGFVWVANGHTGTSTLYDGLGVKSPAASPLVVTIPAAPGSAELGSPTGIVFSSSNDFAVTSGTKTGPSRFIFATEDGVIAGWAPTVDGTHAILGWATPNAIYKGLALASAGTGNFLYATDFHGGKIDVFDKSFHPSSVPGGFKDPLIPPGYAPFGIQNLGGDLYVTYAKQDDTRHDNVSGRGFGYVSVFTANGQLIRHIAPQGQLNAPWGLALAPAEFGEFSNRLLVGNFGDGAILAFDLHSGRYVGKLRKGDGKPLKIDGLWGLQFGNGLLNQGVGSLYFAAGPSEESQGLYGRIDYIPVNCHLGDDD